jgi:hypothetical protein
MIREANADAGDEVDNDDIFDPAAPGKLITFDDEKICFNFKNTGDYTFKGGEKYAVTITKGALVDL